MYPYVTLRCPIPRKFTRQSHLGFAIAPKRLFFSSGSTARVGSIPIARSTFRCLACACVVLGRGSVHRPVPTVSTPLQLPLIECVDRAPRSNSLDGLIRPSSTRFCFPAASLRKISILESLAAAVRYTGSRVVNRQQPIKPGHRRG
jgi:hypothetical protein